MASGVASIVIFAFILLKLFIIMGGGKVEGRRNISEEEDLEFERQLRILNKPAIKTIKTEYGDVYNCVDMYKQPAFDHPLLRNHKIQIPKGYWSSKMQTLARKPANFELKEGCPLGTVPIRNVTKDDLIRVKSVSKMYAERYGQKSIPPNPLEFAGLHTVENPSREYHGSVANIDLYNPKVEPQEFSSALISIESGPPNERNIIRVGWTVNPPLYGDTNTRLFTSWTRDNHHTTGCFNILCSGFILMRSDTPLDFVFTPVSRVSHEQYDVRLGMRQQAITKVWYLVMGEDEDIIGYWPPEIFSHLASGAEFIQWGGEVFSPNPEHHSPQMGSGVWHNGWYDETCFMRRLYYDDSNFTPVNPDNAYIQRDVSRCYWAFADNSLLPNLYWQYTFQFGGPGGPEYDCF